ncbi:acyl-coenzyme a thioesterase 13 [Trichoderma cornu-damae]|uniref:Acyl-coenzyme a thioesterase 13 n=1 Tax=Trichoderma cornu-damae TaxID=654480 RepID=A0A9P8QIG6_9HYPO|nr:acyl-coenzyme a thioesterase 13 [Trichoderma cornu-damae]
MTSQELLPSSKEAELAAKRTAHVEQLSTWLVENSPIYNILLSDIRHTSVVAGTVTSRLALTPTHLNSKGGLHGAVSAAIIDFTTGLAIASWDLREKTGASVDMHISYLSSAAGAGDVVEIVATAEKVGGSMAFVTILIQKIEAVDGEEKRTIVTKGHHTKFVRQSAKAPPPRGGSDGEVTK